MLRPSAFARHGQSPFLLRCVAVSLAAVVALLAAPAGAAPDGREVLKKSVDQLLNQPPLAGSRASVDIVSLDDGSTIYSHDGDAALNPASNTKLITAAAALLRLGPEYRFDTDVLADRAPDKRGKVGTLYVRGRGDPSITTERLTGMVRDLFHRGVRSVGDVVIDESYFDAEKWGPGWEQESSDKAYAAPVGALSLNHNTVAIYVRPGDRAGAKGLVELEPDAPGYFQLSARVATVRTNGRRKVRPHTFELRDGTQVTVDGRVPAGGEPMVFFRRVTEPGMYFGQTLRATLLQNGIRVTGRVRRAVTPASAYLVTTYDSEELADIVRDMNKVSSNFIAEMLIKTLGAELRGPPGTWAKGIDVAEELLAEVGLPRGSYQLKNGSGLNDTNRFSAHQMVTLLTAIWKKFPVASEFVSSLGIAARDGTLRLRMEGTDAAGRLRAKTGTLDRVTALSGFVQSVGGERFAFSILVNDWTGRASPVVSSIDRLGGLIASFGAPEAGSREALAALAPSELAPGEQRARIATYAAMAQRADKKSIPALRTALRSERDPLVRAMAADALYRSDPDGGGGALLEALPASAELFARLRSVTREMALPVPVVSSLLDLAVDGSSEAFTRLLTFAPLSRVPQRDDALSTALSDGLVEVGDASPDELLAAVRAAPADQARIVIELLADGLSRADLDPDETPLAKLLRTANPSEIPQAPAWLALLEQRNLVPPPAVAPLPVSPDPGRSASVAQTPAVPVASSSLGAGASAGPSQPASAAPAPTAASPRETAAAAQAAATALEAAAAAKVAAGTVVPAAFSPRPGEEDGWPVTSIPNPAWPRSGPAAPTPPAAPAAAPVCTPEPQSCSARPPDASRPGG
ncbi:MAG: D-alanyl-D-alanine carboxypeptidase/D-alanyl-D-alanine-endopeptidase [Myxococcales bacterium]